MEDETPILTAQIIRQEAREILGALKETQTDGKVFENNWQRLWQLVREARAATLPFQGIRGPWHLGSNGNGRSEALLTLIGGGFRRAIWPPDQARFGADLIGLLNWAGVPVK
jgi:hypothetical protein